MIFSYGRMGDHEALMQGLRHSRATQPGFTVIDIGSVDNPWTFEVLTATVDIRETRFDEADIRHFRGNLNDYKLWFEILAYVELHGKFSFSVCSHTLEDLAYPQLTLEMLPQISERGYIATPSWRQELKREAECRPWRGYIHHRWMFAERDGALLLLPKVPFIEHVPLPSDCPGDQTELRLCWEGNIPWSVVNDDYLGPNIEYVMRFYEEILR